MPVFYEFRNKIDTNLLIYDDGKMVILSRHDNYERNIEKDTDTEILHKKRAILNGMLLRGLVYNNEEKFYKDMKSFFAIKRIYK